MINQSAQQLRLGLQRAACSAALIALLPLAGHAADSDKRYALERSGFLQMKVPAGWRDEVDATTKPPVISFRPAEGQPFLISVTPAQAIEGSRVPSRKKLREDVAQMAAAIRHFSIEGDKIKLKEFAGSSGPGFEFFATDSAPAAGEFKYMTRGKLNVGDVSVTFTILTNDGQENVIRAAQATLQGARRVAR
ncbi:MAG: hypothetical protein JWN94_491 [Betaproteobacteria bacterium]|nr:hypothetical protein [Betaproteobacteria bacterium]